MKKLILISSIVFLVSLIVSLSMFGLAHTNVQEFDTKINATGNELELKASSADISIELADVDSIQFHHTGHIKYPEELKWGMPELRVRDHGDVVEAELTSSKNGYVVLGEMQELSVILPQDFNGTLAVHTTSGSVEASQQLQYLHASTSSGDLVVESVKEADMETVSGDVYINDISEGELRSVSGDITISTEATVDFESLSGDAVGEFSPGGDVTVKTTSGDLIVK